MIGKILGGVVILGLLFTSTMMLYENLPRSPVNLTIETIENQTNESKVDYGDTPVFLENLRFNHNNISYLIDSSCPEERALRMVEAFEIFEGEMDLISFYKSSSNISDIYVGCSDDYISLGEELFAAGEGGPSRIVMTSNFNVIEEGKISLYKESHCDYPVVELHELLHVFGFNHIDNEDSLMYNVSRCHQRITSDMIRIINELYAIEPLPDLRIANVSAVKKGKYLDFEITILNEGLVDSPMTNLLVTSFGIPIKSTTLRTLPIGRGITITASDLKLPSRSSEEIEFYVDEKKRIDELDEENNYISMIVDQ